jgi:hypothetical protein
MYLFSVEERNLKIKWKELNLACNPSLNRMMVVPG